MLWTAPIGGIECLLLAEGVEEVRVLLDGKDVAGGATGGV